MDVNPYWNHSISRIIIRVYYYGAALAAVYFMLDQAVGFVGLYCFLKISPSAVHTRRLIMVFIFSK